MRVRVGHDVSAGTRSGLLEQAARGVRASDSRGGRTGKRPEQAVVERQERRSGRGGRGGEPRTRGGRNYALNDGGAAEDTSSSEERAEVEGPRAYAGGEIKAGTMVDEELSPVMSPTQAALNELLSADPEPSPSPPQPSLQLTTDLHEAVGTGGDAASELLQVEAVGAAGDAGSRAASGSSSSLVVREPGPKNLADLLSSDTSSSHVAASGGVSGGSVGGSLLHSGGSAGAASGSGAGKSAPSSDRFPLSGTAKSASSAGNDVAEFSVGNTTNSSSNKFASSADVEEQLLQGLDNPPVVSSSASQGSSSSASGTGSVGAIVSAGGVVVPKVDTTTKKSVDVGQEGHTPRLGSPRLATPRKLGVESERVTRRPKSPSTSSSDASAARKGGTSSAPAMQVFTTGPGVAILGATDKAASQVPSPDPPVVKRVRSISELSDDVSPSASPQPSKTTRPKFPPVSKDFSAEEDSVNIGESAELPSNNLLGSSSHDGRMEDLLGEAKDMLGDEEKVGGEGALVRDETPIEEVVEFDFSPVKVGPKKHQLTLSTSSSDEEAPAARAPPPPAAPILKQPGPKSPQKQLEKRGHGGGPGGSEGQQQQDLGQSIVSSADDLLGATTGSALVGEKGTTTINVRDEKVQVPVMSLDLQEKQRQAKTEKREVFDDILDILGGTAPGIDVVVIMSVAFFSQDKIGNLGLWCSGITSASHAEGPGFKSRQVHFLQSAGSFVLSTYSINRKHSST